MARVHLRRVGGGETIAKNTKRTGHERERESYNDEKTMHGNAGAEGRERGKRERTRTCNTNREERAHQKRNQPSAEQAINRLERIPRGREQGSGCATGAGTKAGTKAGERSWKIVIETEAGQEVCQQ